MSNYRSILRRLATRERSIHYLCTKFDWSLSTFDSIDWQSHSRAINANFPKRHFIIKLIHDWLPLGHLRSRYATYYQDSCPLCPSTLETLTPFLRCPHRLWFPALLADLEKQWSSLNADPHLAMLLTECLRSRLHDVPPSFPTVPLPYQRAVASQLTIGLEQVFMGRFSLHWSRLQDQFLISQDISSPLFSGSRLISSTITLSSGTMCIVYGCNVTTIFMAILHNQSKLPLILKRNEKFSNYILFGHRSNLPTLFCFTIHPKFISPMPPLLFN